MKLNNLIAKPQLVKVELSDDETIAQFGEAIEWYVWDRQSLDKFLKLASSEGNASEQIVETVREMVLDEEGKPMLQGDATLPTAVMLKVMNKMVEMLGK
jgi:hypothetical protein